MLILHAICCSLGQLVRIRQGNPLEELLDSHIRYIWKENPRTGRSIIILMRGQTFQKECCPPHFRTKSFRGKNAMKSQLQKLKFVNILSRMYDLFRCVGRACCTTTVGSSQSSFSRTSGVLVSSILKIFLYCEPSSEEQSFNSV